MIPIKRVYNPDTTFSSIRDLKERYNLQPDDTFDKYYIKSHLDTGIQLSVDTNQMRVFNENKTYVANVKPI